MSLASVLSVGACGPLGPTALAVAMGVRARKRDPRPCHLRDKRDRAVRLCLSGGLGAELYGYERLLELAAPAVAEAAAPLPELELPLVMALPEPERPDDDERFASELVTALARSSGVPLAGNGSSLVRLGHAGCGVAMRRALELLGSGAPAVMVGGVDSYYHPQVISWLDEAHRLHGHGVEDGITPSEGAAFFVVAPYKRRGELAASEPLALLTHLGEASERSVGSDEPNLAQAMTKLLADIAEQAGPIGWALPDLNSERHRSREWQMVAMRGALDADAVVARMVEQLGDVGAATGATLLATAVSWWQSGCAPADACVVALHSEGAERSAFRLQDATAAEEA